MPGSGDKNIKKQSKMITSQKGIDLIKHYEGFRAKAYHCPAGLLTIGYGTVIDKPSEKWLKDAELTQEKAEQILAGDLHFYETEVTKMISGVKLAQYQFDALVSFAYNLGPQALRGSTLLKVIRAGEMEKVESNFSKWVYCNGEVLLGLQKRRNSEAILFNTGQLKFF